MPPLGNATRNSFCKLLGAVAVVAILSATAQADVIHKYTFNANTAVDSVGGADGTVIDATGIATYTGGALNLTANNGINSAALNTVGAAGAYVDLPNNLLTNAVVNNTGNGVIGQATLEMWLTVQENRPWAEAFVFGTSSGGEGISDNGDGRSYIAMIPQSGGGFNDFRGTTRSPTAETPIIGSPAPLAVNQRHHVVMVLDGLDQTAGLNGTASLYLNDGAPVTGAIQPFIDAMINDNNWLGRSLFGGDALFDGLIDEFSIYNHALSAAEVAANFAQKPVAAPVPTLVVNRDTGEVRIANESAGNIDLKGYTITSAAGALNPTGWTSIDAGNVFDNDGTWTSAAPPSNAQIGESTNTGNGGTLTPTPTPNSSRTIGSAWLETPFQDLAFTFTLGDNSTGTGQVQYIGSAALRSDFNGDELINAADWTAFKNNSYTSLAGLPAAQAYLKGDLDGDLDNDFQDFRLFKADFIAASGEAAFAALVGAVPEPATFTLAAAAAAILLGASRRRS